MAKAKALQASMEELGHSAALCKQVMATQEQEQRPAPAPAGVATGKSPDREHPERPRPAKELPGSFGPSSSVQHSKDVEQADAAGAAAGCTGGCLRARAREAQGQFASGDSSNGEDRKP
eukprot:gnl/TRDRNA2_/TRDRNA2_174687_c0_seq16.p4 gnl/TRDRNA2_/TRDRNA2_174687_c0~~gnl/TRDRNA2_/TRDRNA2_174687_c0_seq16.p4  ORF type:complete len:119 (+),score=22.55 gnl/TRDRNA2_/TRDRNA2_174687_c0_seq16:473-829(+)